MRFAVLGAGAYGTAVGTHIKNLGLDVEMWSRSGQTELTEVIASADVLILGVPAQQMRTFLSEISTDKPVVSLAKGIEAQNLKRMSEVVEETLGTNRYAVLSGPSFAKDIVEGNAAITSKSKSGLASFHTSPVVEQTHICFFTALLHHL